MVSGHLHTISMGPSKKNYMARGMCSHNCRKYKRLCMVTVMSFLINRLSGEQSIPGTLSAALYHQVEVLDCSTLHQSDCVGASSEY